MSITENRKNRKGRIRTARAGPLALVLISLLVFVVPRLPADKKIENQEAFQSAPLSKAFKGKLPITELSEDEAILHALNRLGYGPRPGDVERVREMGLEKWIDQQLHPEISNDSTLQAHLNSFRTLKMSTQQLLENFPPPNQAAKKEGLTKQEFKQQQQEKRREQLAQMNQAGQVDKAQEMLARMQGPQRIIAELSMAKLDRAICSQWQLEAVMEDFWFNHFNVFAGKGADRWMLTEYVRDVIRPQAMGRFSDLLLATAKSPAMLFYLDNWLSADPLAGERMQQELARRRRRFQGIFEGGTFPRRGTFPAGRNPSSGPANRPAPKQLERGLNENYGREVMELHTLGVGGGFSQPDVIEMAKCLTGWTIRAPRRQAEFYFDDRIHKQGKKIVLGRKIDYGGVKDGEKALKMLASHPSTANFISTKLARHFVSDNPPPALVDRMARSFLSSSGDIRAVLKTMIYSPEFWSRAAYRAKVKTPFELAASAARALGAEVSVPLPLVQWVGRMGEPLYMCQPPTGYSDKAETWVNSGALLNRLNFALAFSSGRMPGVTSDLETLFGPDAAADPHVALARALDIFVDGQVAALTRATLEQHLNDPQVLQARLDDPVKHVNEALIAGLVLGAPEFQRR